LNPDLSFNSSTGQIAGVSAAGITPFDKRSYRITASNSIGTVVQTNYDLSVTEDPSDLTLGQMQVVRVTNTSRFNIGQRFATSSGIKGRILDIATNKAMLVLAEDLIPDNDGIDNVPFYIAPETTKLKYALLYVDSNAFSNGESISTPAGAQGTVEAAFNDAVNSIYRVYVKISAGSFSEGEVVDDVATYATKAATVINVNNRQYVNTILNLASAASFEIGSYITSASTSGVGLVVYKDTNKVFVQVISGTFSQGDSVDNANPYSAGATTISSVKGPNIKVATTVAHGFTEGSNLTAFNGTYQAAGSILAGSSGTTLYTSLEDGIIESGDGLDDVNPFVASGATVAAGVGSVDSDNTLYLYSGEKYYFPIYLKGTYTNITIDPALPDGLSIDKTSAVISGIPTEPQSRTTHTLTVRNGSAIQQFSFDIVVTAQFRIVNSTENASSYILHKEGQGFKTSACRVTTDQIDNYPGSTNGVNNVNCRLEAEENDLGFYGLSLDVVTSPGMCEYVRFTPFAFWSKPPGTTAASFIDYQFTGDPTACSAASAIPEVTSSGAGPFTWAPTQGNGGATAVRDWGDSFCASGDCFNGGDPDVPTTPGCGFNYSDMNCDDGSYTMKVVSCAEGSGECSCTVTTQIISCGGDNLNCMDGPRRDLNLSKAKPMSYDSEVYDAFAGGTTTYATKSGLDVPSTGAKKTNAYYSNWVSGNACINADGYTYDSDTWTAYSDLSSLTSGYFYPKSPYSNLNQFYTFECLDAAQDVKARINVQVRDWDKKFTTSNAIDQLIVGSPMDDLTTTCFGAQCDNIRDSDALARSQDDTASLTNYATCATPTAGTTALGGTITITAGFTSATTSADLRSTVGEGTLIYCNNALGDVVKYEPLLVRRVSSATSLILEVTPRADMSCTLPLKDTGGRHNFFVDP